MAPLWPILLGQRSDRRPERVGLTDRFRRLIDVQVTVSSIENIPCQCTYDVREINGLGTPVNRTFDLAPRGSTQLTSPAQLLGQTYHVVVACRGDVKCLNVEFGRGYSGFWSMRSTRQVPSTRLS
jgi:hypothetical protein